MAALGAVIGSLAAASCVSAASAATWTVQPAPAPSGAPDAALAAVSCPSSTSCMAVGSSDFGFDRLAINLVGPIATFAERWDGASWTVLPTPSVVGSPALLSVSCASPTFCVAVGSTQTGGRQYLAGLTGAARNARALLEMWDGTGWAVRATPLSSVRGGRLTGVSCVSSSFCMAVGSTGLVWNGSSWRQVKLPAVRYHATLTAVSCVAAGDCTAVGSRDADKTGVAYLLPLAAHWRAGRWTVSRPPGERDVYHGKPYVNDTWLTSVSCPSRAWCLATGQTLRTQNFYPQGGFADVWNGRRWTAAATGLARNSPLNGVGCVAPGDCFAAGQYDPRTITSPATQQPLLMHWTGRAWSRESVPRTATLTNRAWNAGNLLDPDLFGVGCVLRTGCSAVGAQPAGARSAPLAMSTLPGPG